MEISIAGYAKLIRKNLDLAASHEIYVHARNFIHAAKISGCMVTICDFDIIKPVRLYHLSVDTLRYCILCIEVVWVL